MSIDHSTIGRRSKNKGKAYERRVADLLSEFLNKNFRRTPGSGGFGKQGVIVAEHAFTGDVICDDSGFRFSIECKNRPNDFSFAQLVSVPDKAPFTEWWHQAVEDANSVSLSPLLFFKGAKSATKTVGSDFIATTKEILDLIGYSGPRVVIDIYDGPMTITIREKGTMIDVVTDLPTPCIVGWRQIIQSSDPQKFFKVL